MAKDNPDALTAQYKVLIRPTDVGLLVMKRLQRPALDKSAELRRLIELGYAAEQAGFILDGTMLRNGGRIWDVQPVFASEGGLEQGKAAQPDATASPSSTSFISGVDPPVEPPTEADASVDREATTRIEAKGGAGTGLRANLRKTLKPLTLTVTTQAAYGPLRFFLAGITFKTATLAGNSYYELLGMWLRSSR